jgi:hypothetical protein
MENNNKEESVYFRFYNQKTEIIDKFIEELMSINNPTIKKIIRTEIIDTNKSINPLLPQDTSIKEVKIWFSSLEECHEFHKVNGIRELYQKYTNMSEITNQQEIVHIEPEPHIPTISELKIRLSMAIKKEDYDLCAKFRDEIKQLELGN